MKIDRSEILTIFPGNNFVIIKPIMNNEEITTKSGLKLWIDSSWLPENHAKVYGEVISVPKQLIFCKKGEGKNYTMEWETEMDLKIGDMVLYNYLAALNAEKYRHLSCDGEVFYIIPYEKIYMIMKEDGPIMLNGYVLVEREKDKTKSKLQLLEKDSERIGRIKQLSRPNTDYLYDYQDDDRPRIGDRVVLAYRNYKKLESAVHAIFDTDKELLVVQRYQLAAILR